MAKQKQTEKKVQRIYRAALQDENGKALKDDAGNNVVLFFPYPVKVNGQQVLKADGSPAGKDALKMERTPLKDNVASMSDEDGVYYNADTMTKEERKALARRNTLTVGSRRLSEPIAQLNELAKWLQLNASKLPREMREDGWNKLVTSLEMVKGTLLPAEVPTTEKKAGAAKVKPNYFTEYFAS